MAISKYPPSPSNTDMKAMNPKKEYKHEVLKVSGAITLFFIVYSCLVVLSVGLAAFVTYIGMEMIIIKPMFVTIILGLGLIGLGIMVLYFLIKFIFAVKKYDRSGLYEITEKEHPDLYAFIRQLTKETRTPMPKRIYLSPEVNASVFYDSSFLTMFFPVRKNLLIGLGLVNSVNISEFKAVIAHEFGHFSQHSMKLGAYVFNVNKMIHNMLYDNDGYGKTLDSWASISGYFKFFVVITVKIVQGIQWVLQKVYKLVNKSNLSLSRQMEYHADSVSAFVSGPNHLITSLRRLELADTCYNVLLDSWSKWICDNIKPINLYDCHREIMAHCASELGMPLVNGLPVIEISVVKNKNRLMIKNEWASHPSNEDRELYLRSLNIQNTSVDDESPWLLFNSAEDLQEKITAKLFLNVRYEGDCQSIGLAAFKEKYYFEIKGSPLNKKYKGYYDNRRLVPINIDSLVPATNYMGYDELFSDENCAMPGDSAALKADLQTLEALQSKQYDVKTFDFDGKKYKLKEIPVVLNQIETEVAALQNKINALDAEILKSALSRSDPDRQTVLIDLYKHYFAAASDAETGVTSITYITEEISPIYKGNMTVDKAKDIVNTVRSIEKEIKTQIRNVFTESRQQKYLSSAQLDKIEQYLSSNSAYFNGAGFNSSELEIFNEAIGLFLSLMLEREYQAKKKMLEKQIEIFDAGLQIVCNEEKSVSGL